MKVPQIYIGNVNNRKGNFIMLVGLVIKQEKKGSNTGNDTNNFKEQQSCADRFFVVVVEIDGWSIRKEKWKIILYTITAMKLLPCFPENKTYPENKP